MAQMEYKWQEGRFKFNRITLNVHNKNNRLKVEDRQNR